METDEVGLAPALFDGWGLKAYQPVLLEAAPSNRVEAQNLPRFVVAAVPSSGGLSPTELRVHNDLLHRLVDRFGSSTAHISTNLNHSDATASEVEAELVGPTGLDRLGTTDDVFAGALRRRMAGKWSGVGCTVLVPLVGRTYELVVRRVVTQSPVALSSVDSTTATTTTATGADSAAPVQLFALTRETQWRIVPSRSTATANRPVALSDEEPLSEIERQARTLLELEMRRKSLGKSTAGMGISVGSGVLLTGVAGVGKWSAAQRIARAIGAELIEINLASSRNSLNAVLKSTLQRVQSADHHTPQRPVLVVLRQLEVFAAPPADEDASHKWSSTSTSSGGDKTSAASRLLDFVDSLALLPGVAIAGLLRQGYTLPSAFLRPPRFDHTFSIPAPAAPARLRLLQSFLGPHSPTDADLRYLAEATQGYVLRDLVRLSRRIALLARVRVKQRSDDDGQQSVGVAPRVERQDMEVAMAAVRPSQMFELTVRPPRVSWDDVAGCENARRELEEAVKWGLAADKSPLLASLAQQAGVLLYGPSGCGKTLCAHAFASALHLPFISIKGPELYSKYLGETEGLIRRLFERARQVAPSVIFFDEIDALAPTRSGDTEGMGGMGQRVLSQLLNEMDGVSARSGVLLLACTSRPDLLDPALLRPGRFERLVYVGPPTPVARVHLLQMERRRKVPFAADVAEDKFAVITDGLTPAEILACCREAALLALTEDMNAAEVRWQHVDAAVKQRRQTGGLSLTEEALLPYNKFAHNRRT